MKFRTFAMVSSCIGAFLVVLALFLTYVVVPNLPASTTWSREDGEAYAESAKTYHNATFDESLTEEEVRATADDWQARRDMLDNAIARRSIVPKILRFTGFAFVVTGMSFYVASKVRNEEESEA